jgi:hypothetical protein
MKNITTKKLRCNAILTTNLKSAPPGNFIPQEIPKDSLLLNSVPKELSKALKSAQCPARNLFNVSTQIRENSYHLNLICVLIIILQISGSIAEEKSPEKSRNTALGK